MNLSETTFVYARDAATERDREVRVRIFTVEQDLPFAGHPTLGTALAISRQAVMSSSTVALHGLAIGISDAHGRTVSELVPDARAEAPC